MVAYRTHHPCETRRETPQIAVPSTETTESEKHSKLFTTGGTAAANQYICARRGGGEAAAVWAKQ